MNKEQIIDVISTITSYDYKECETIFKATFIVISKFLEKQETINIKNFGTFKVVKRKDKIGINPITLDKIKIKSHLSVNFKVSQNLKNKLN